MREAVSDRIRRPPAARVPGKRDLQHRQQNAEQLPCIRRHCDIPVRQATIGHAPDRGQISLGTLPRLRAFRIALARLVKTPARLAPTLRPGLNPRAVAGRPMPVRSSRPHHRARATICQAKRTEIGEAPPR